MAASKRLTHCWPLSCYALEIVGPEALVPWTRCGGDLVSQGREEPNARSQASLNWNEGDSARHVLLCDPPTTKAAPLLAELLLMPSPGLRGFWKQAGFAEMTVAQLIEE